MRVKFSFVGGESVNIGWHRLARSGLKEELEQELKDLDTEIKALFTIRWEVR